MSRKILLVAVCLALIAGATKTLPAKAGCLSPQSQAHALDALVDTSGVMDYERWNAALELAYALAADKDGNWEYLFSDIHTRLEVMYDKWSEKAGPSMPRAFLELRNITKNGVPCTR